MLPGVGLWIFGAANCQPLAVIFLAMLAQCNYIVGMKVKIIKIGNSKGIRIPKVLLRQTGIDEEVNLEVIDNQIVLEPIKYKPRSGWNLAFANMAKHQDDKIMDEDSFTTQSSFDNSDWEW